MKAQITIDLIIALVALLMFAGYFMSFLDGFTENTNKAFVLKQEKRIAENIEDIILIANANNAGNIKATITYTIPNIIDPISKKKKGCTINLYGTTLTIKFTYGYGQNQGDTEDITFTKTIINPSNFSISNGSCGTQMVINTGVNP